MPFSSSKLSSITQVETGASLSSGEFHEKIENRRAELLHRFNINAEARVLILQNNTIDFFVNLMAIFRLKATAIPLDPNSSALEIENVKKHSNISLIIDDFQFTPIEPQKKNSLKDIALILYTSGTTGSPKGILISYEALRNKLEALSTVINSTERQNTLCALPTFFGHGLICNSLFPIYYAENFYIAKKFDLKFVNDFPIYLNKYRISFFSSVPSVWDLLLNFCSPQTTNLASLRRVHCASSLLNNDKSKAICEWLGRNTDFYNVFGITEMLGWIASNKISEGHDSNLFEDFFSLQKSFSKTGELFVKSNYMFSGYLENERSTQEAFDDEGFFKTGDIFKENIYIGRLKLVINKKGIKVYPQEIDQFLMESNLVSDCFTFGIADNFSGETIGVLVCLKPGVTLEQIREYCLTHLPPNKFPDRFLLRDKIERNARGKIDLQLLQKLLNEGFQE